MATAVIASFAGDPSVCHGRRRSDCDHELGADGLPTRRHGIQSIFHRARQPPAYQFGCQANGYLDQVYLNPDDPNYGQLGTLYTLDQSGNPALDTSGNPIPAVPDTGIQYSWKGSYSVIGDPLVVGLSNDVPPLALSLASTVHGSLAHNDVAVVHHSIGLFWCGQPFNGSCQGINDPTGVPETDLGFLYSPLNLLPRTSWSDITSNATWVSIIREQAQKALTAAFANVPVITPQHASPLGWRYKGTPDYVVNVVGGEIVPSQNQAADSVGLTKATVSCVDFSIFCNWNSVVYSSLVMFGAQSAGANGGLNSPVYPPVTKAQQIVFNKLVTSVGIGIGNVAAHEIGHQLRLPDMDCDKTGNPPCDSFPPFFNYDDYLTEDSMFFTVGPPLQWTADDKKALAQQLLKK